MQRMSRLIAAALGAALALGVQARGQEKLPTGAQLVRLETQPAALAFKGPYDYSQVVVTGQLATGEQVDVTRMGAWTVPPGLVQVSATGVVRPVGDGQGELKFATAGKTVSIPVKVSGQKAEPQVSFVRDVMPTLSKMGCNAGTCHGSQKGKNGFKLSLRGYDPAFDHMALTDDLQGRRFNRASPDNSLMLLKPSGGAPHVGGVLTRPGEPYYNLLRSWIAQGVKLDKDGARVQGIDILPKNPIVPLPGMRQQMQVMARYSDGSVRDVTGEAFVESSNTEIATADKQGLITAVRRGEAAIMARFEGSYTATVLVVMGDRSGYVWKEAPVYNYIDQLVDEKLKTVKVLPSEVCTDYEFVRRVYLDLIGAPPEPEQVRAFVADPRTSRVKREELIDRLVGSPEYVDHWTNKWADLLQVNRKFLGEQGATALRGYIRKAVAENMPYDQFVRSFLTSSGSTLDNPPASYYKVLRDADSAMENTTQLFLAVRFNCNKCHDHPFERWTQDQYYHLAAFFAQVDRKEDPRFKGQKLGGTDVEGGKPLVEIIEDTKSGGVKNERTGADAAPVFPYAVDDPASPGMPRRQQLAHWVTSRRNPYFAKSYVNRLWSYLLGVGLIEPVDDIRAGNPPTNPKLLDRLTEDFIASGFNAQHMVKTICKSRTYQLSMNTNRWNADDQVNYSHALPRRLTAEVLFDAIHQTTGSPSTIPGLPRGTRAQQLIDSNVEIPGAFLNLFGKPPRESACECERSNGMMLGPVLAMINGPVLANAVKDPENRIARILAREKDNRKVVEELFLAILCRPPSSMEMQKGLEFLDGHRDEYDRFVAEYRKLEAAATEYEKGLDARQPAWEARTKAPAAWNVLDTSSVESKGGASWVKQADGSILFSGKNAVTEVVTVRANTMLKGITGVRLEVLPDPSLPAMGPGRAPNGNFVLNEFKMTASSIKEPGKARPIALHNAQADFSQDSWAVGGAIDGNPQSGWAVSPQFGKNHVAVFELKEPLTLPEGATLTFTLDEHFGQQHTIGRFRLSVTTDGPPIYLSGPPQAITAILAIEPAKRTAAQKATLQQFYRATDTELPRLQRAVAEFGRPVDPRQVGAQDLVWALLNTKSFLFNR